MGTEISWAAVEDAVLTALKAEVGTLAGTLESYQGDWRGDLRLKGRRLPAVLVVLRESRAAPVGVSSYEETLTLTVLVAVRQLRGSPAARRQDGGVYQLLTGVRRALWHRDQGLEMLPLGLVREEPWLNDPEFAVYAAHYLTRLIRDF
jgi:phage gp37-like protein